MDGRGRAASRSKRRPSHRAGELWAKASSSYPREVAGEGHYQAALSRICGGHKRNGHALESVAVLRPEPDNAYDPNAVQVTIDGELVGYLSRADAERFTRESAKQGHAGAAIRTGAKVVGGWRTNQHDEGSFGVYLGFVWPLRIEAR